MPNSTFRSVQRTRNQGLPPAEGVAGAVTVTYFGVHLLHGGHGSGTVGLAPPTHTADTTPRGR